MKCLRNLLRSSFYRCGIGDSPMRRHWLSRPIRTLLLRCVVADREDEIEMRRFRSGEFIPGLASEPFSRDSGRLELLQCLRPGLSSWVAPGTIGFENSFSLMVQNCLSHNGSGRIPRAQEKYAVSQLHFYAFARVETVVQQSESQKAAFGLEARMNPLMNFL